MSGLTPTEIIASLTRRHSHDGYTSYPELCRAYEAQISRMGAELAQYTGAALTPQAGCALLRTTWDQAPVVVELEIQPEEGDGWYLPHYPERVEVVGVLVNGRMCRASIADDETRERWVDEFIAERRAERDEALIATREAA
jgi:hypothetical protein